MAQSAANHTSTRRVALLIGITAVAVLATGVTFTDEAAAATVPTISRPVTFTDTFDNGRVDGWSRLDEGHTGGPSRWSVVGTHLFQSTNVYGGSTSGTDISTPGTNFIAGNPAWTNYDLSVRAASSDDDAFGVIFRYVDSDNYYRFSMDKQRHYRRLVVKHNGKFRLLAHGTYGYVSGTTYTMRALVTGSRIRIYVNGSQTYDVTDSTLDHGRIGLYTWGAPTSFDSVTVQAQNDSYFTVAVVPDMQNESQFQASMLMSQMQWLSAHRATQNLAMVLQEGDLVNTLSDPTQWATVRRYLGYLGGKVPLVVAAGNHDLQDYANSHYPYATEPTAFNASIASVPNYAVSGRYGESTDFRNTYRLVSAGGVDLMVLNLEFGAPDDVLVWAGKVVDRYPARHVILLTHDYLGQTGELRGTRPDDAYLPSALNPTLNNGVGIWQKFVSQHANVQFVFNGHVIASTSPTEHWSVGRLTSQNDAQRSVFQLLANYQTVEDGGGYIRLLHFYPALNKVTVVTYSPYGSTGYLKDDGNQFTLSDVDLGTWPPSPPPAP